MYIMILIIWDTNTRLLQKFICFQGYVPVSPVVVCITLDDCTAQCLRVHMATCLTAQNMGSFEFAFFFFILEAIMTETLLRVWLISV